MHNIRAKVANENIDICHENGILKWQPVLK